MSVVGKTSFTVTSPALPYVVVPVSNVQWNGRNFSTNGSYMGINYTATGTANGSKLTGEIFASVVFLAPCHLP